MRALLRGLIIIAFFLTLTISNLFGDNPLVNKWLELNDSAEAKIKQSQIDSAIFYAEKNLKFAEDNFGRQDSLYLYTLSRNIDLQYYVKNYEKTLAYARIDSVLRYETIDEKPGAYLSALSVIEALQEMLKQYREAEALFDDMFAVATKYYGENHIKYADVCQKYGKVLFYLGNNDNSIEEFNKALKIYKAQLPKDDDKYFSALNWRAYVYEVSKKYPEAENDYLEILEIKRNVLGEEHADYIESLQHLAVFYRDAGNIPEADSTLKIILSLYQKTKGEKSKEYIEALNQTAVFYTKELMYDKAESAMLKSAELSRETMGEESVEYVAALENLVNLYNRKEEYPKGIKLLEKIIEIYEKTTPGHNLLYLLAVKNLGVLNARTGHYEQADSAYTKELALRKKYYGDTDEDYRNSLYNLALFYKDYNRSSLAAGVMNEIISIYESSFSAQDSLLIDIYYQAGVFYEQLGMTDRAEVNYINLVETSRKFNGEKHPDFLIFSKVLADFYNHYKQPGKALEILNRINKTEKIVFGKKSKDIAISYKLYALAYFQYEDYQKAKEYAEMAENIMSLSPDEVTYSSIINLLALINEKLGDYEEVEKYYKKSARLYKNLVGESDPNYHNVLYNLAEFYINSRKFHKADSVYSYILDVQEKANGQHHISAANTKIKKARLFYFMENYSEAEKYFNKSLDIYRQFYGPESREYRMQAYNNAITLRNMKKYKASENLCNDLINSYKKYNIKEDSIYIYTLASLSKVLSKTGRLQEAEHRLLESLKLYEEKIGTKDSNYVFLLSAIGGHFADVYEYEKSDEYYGKAISTARTNYGKNSRVYLVAAQNYSDMLKLSGRYKSAEKYLKEALKAYSKSPGSNNYARSLADISDLYIQSGEIIKAEEYINKAISIIESNNIIDSLELSNFLNIKALILKKIGKFAKSEKIYLKTLQMKRNINLERSANYAVTEDNLANLYSYLGRQVKAAELYIDANSIFRNVLGEKHVDYAVSLQNLGSFYLTLRRYDLAEKYCKDAIELYKDILGEGHLATTITMDNLALTFTQQGKYKKAEKLFKESLEFRRKNYGKFQYDNAITWDNLSKVYQETDRLSQAEAALKNSLLVYSKTIGKEHDLYSGALSRLAFLAQAQKHDKEAEKYYKSGIESYISQIDKNFPFFSEKEKMMFYYHFKYHFERFNFFAVERYSKNPKILNNLFDYRMVTKALLLNSTQKIKRRILSSGDDALIDNYKQWKGLKDHIARLSAKSGNMNSSSINLDSLEEYANKLEKYLAEKSEFFAKEYEKKKIIWKDVKNSLGDNEAAIEIIKIKAYDYLPNRFNPNIKNLQRVDSVIYAALIVKKSDREHPELVILPNGKDLENKYFQFYHRLIELQKKDAITEDDLKKQLSALYDQYWTKISAALTGIKRVYISQDGVYNQINLETLYNGKTGKYLLEEIDIHIITSSKSIALNKISGTQDFGSVNKKKESVLFGAPLFKMSGNKYAKTRRRFLRRANSAVEEDYDYSEEIAMFDNPVRGGVRPLPGTLTEVNIISGFMEAKDWSVNKYIKEEALEEAIKGIDSPSILHIATHGKFLEDIEDSSAFILGRRENYIKNPLLRSMLLFAGAENTLLGNDSRRNDKYEDGILSAYEAMNLDLEGTDLVVLSACETGLGEIISGEGVYGMQRAFMVAGAKTLVMSLWPVSDKATSSLMINFYKKWLGGLDKREAFKQARLELMNKYPGFYYWGAFVMIGE